MNVSLPGSPVLNMDLIINQFQKLGLYLDFLGRVLWVTAKHLGKQ